MERALTIDVAIDIISKFDFQKVRNYLLTQNDVAPTLEEMRSTALLVLQRAIDNGDSCHNVSSGGFHAYKLDNKLLYLMFSIETKSLIDEKIS
jgi:hypothetical protein